MENIVCPVCGGKIYIESCTDRGACDTCDAVFVDGIIYEEDGGKVYAEN